MSRQASCYLAVLKCSFMIELSTSPRDYWWCLLTHIWLTVHLQTQYIFSRSDISNRQEVVVWKLPINSCQDESIYRIQSPLFSAVYWMSTNVCKPTTGTNRQTAVSNLATMHSECQLTTLLLWVIVKVTDSLTTARVDNNILSNYIY